MIKAISAAPVGDAPVDFDLLDGEVVDFTQHYQVFGFIDGNGDRELSDTDTGDSPPSPTGDKIVVDGIKDSVHSRDRLSFTITYNNGASAIAYPDGARAYLLDNGDLIINLKDATINASSLPPNRHLNRD